VSNLFPNSNVPQIPQPIADIGSLTVVAQALKQGIDSLAGNRGQPFDRAVTFTDLASIGLTGAIQMQTSSTGIPSALNITSLIASGAAQVGSLTVAGITVCQDIRSGPITQGGASFTVNQSNLYTAAQIGNWVFGGTLGNQLFDAVRGVASINPSSTAFIVSGIAGYVVGEAPLISSAQVSCGLLGLGIADVDGAAVWGMNTVLTDNRGQGAVTHGTRYLYNEFDFNVMSPNTQLTGLQFGGTCSSQPAAAAGIGFNSLGPGIKWTTCLVSGEGVTNTFAIIGSVAASGASQNSQNIVWHYRDSGGVQQPVTQFIQTNGSFNIGSFVSLPQVGATPGNPVAGQIYFYVDTDGHLKAKNSAGATATIL
jgi:hypothetical protein